MLVLALDTAMSGCSVAIFRDGTELAGEREAMTFGQAEALMPMIQRVAEQAGIAFDDLELIAVTVGPGSFTGLRVGLAAAMGLSIATGAPVHGVTTSEALAREGLVQAPGQPILTMIDSRRAEAFVQTFDRDGQALTEPQALTPADAATQAPDGPLAVTGDAAAALIDALGDRQAVLVNLTVPDPAVVAAIAVERFDAPLPPEPVYIRPPDAALPKNGGRLRP